MSKMNECESQIGHCVHFVIYQEQKANSNPKLAKLFYSLFP